MDPVGKWNTIAGRRLDTLRKELAIFQYAVFPMLSKSGYFGDYGFGSAAKLWSLLSSNSPYHEKKKANLQEEIRENFRLGFEWLLYEKGWLTSHREEAVKLQSQESNMNHYWKFQTSINQMEL